MNNNSSEIGGWNYPIKKTSFSNTVDSLINQSINRKPNISELLI